MLTTSLFFNLQILGLLNINTEVIFMTKKLEKQKKELMTYLHKLNFHFMREGYGYGKKILDFVLKSAQIQVEKNLGE